MKLVYVSSPYSGDTLNTVYNNVQMARDLAVTLWNRGNAVICPHLNSQFMDGVVPYDRFIEADLLMLSKCEELYAQLWEDSKGSLREIRYAIKHNIKCYEYSCYDADFYEIELVLVKKAWNRRFPEIPWDSDYE